MVFTTSSSVGFGPVATGTPVLSSVILKPLCRSSFPVHTLISGRKLMTGKLCPADKWQDGTAPRAAHRQTAATEEKDGNKSPPGA